MSERNRESDGMDKLLRVENLSKDRILNGYPLKWIRGNAGSHGAVRFGKVYASL